MTVAIGTKLGLWKIPMEHRSTKRTNQKIVHSSVNISISILNISLAKTVILIEIKKEQVLIVDGKPRIKQRVKQSYKHNNKN